MAPAREFAGAIADDAVGGKRLAHGHDDLAEVEGDVLRLRRAPLEPFPVSLLTRGGARGGGLQRFQGEPDIYVDANSLDGSVDPAEFARLRVAVNERPARMDGCD